MYLGASELHPVAAFGLDVFDKVIKFLAVVIGAAWTYINFMRSRTYQRKFEPSISANIFSKQGGFYALVSCHLKNVGQSVNKIEQLGSGVEGVTLTDNGRMSLPTSQVFTDHEWLEPGEQIDEHLVIPIPDPRGFVALRLNLRIVSERIEWNASCIAYDTAQALIDTTEVDK